MTVTWKKDYLRDRLEELKDPHFPHSKLKPALELIQEILVQMAEEHGLFKDACD